MKRPGIVVSALLLILSRAPALPADILLLDRAAKTVSRLEVSSLAVRASASLPEVPTRVVLSPDGATVVVLCRGAGEDKSDGFKASTRAQAVVLEAATLKVRARVELGWGLGPAMWDAPGRALVVLSPGFPSTDPEKLQMASVVSVDLAGTSRRVQLDRAAGDMVISSDGSVAAVLSTRVDGEPRLAFADLAKSTSGDAAPLDGEPRELLLAPDGVTLYVLDRGESKKVVRVRNHRRTRGKDAPGSLAVFSLAERRKTGDIPIGAITAIGGFDRTGRLILGGTTAEDMTKHSIYVVKGDDIEWEVPGPTAPTSFRFLPDVRNAMALGSNSAFVDFGDFSTPPKVSIVSVDGRGRGFEATPDGKLAVAHDPEGKNWAEVTIYELASGKKLKTFDTASFGARLGGAVLAAGATVASIDAGRREAEAHGRSTYTYSIYTPATRRSRGTPVVIRPDGKVAFVYDLFGSDVLSLDLEKLEKGKRFSAGKGSRGLFLAGSGKTLLVASEAGLSVFSTSPFEKKSETKTDGPAEIQMGPSGETLLLAKGLVATIDPETGAIAARSTSFGLPAIGAFLP